MASLAVLTARPDLAIYRELEAAGPGAGHEVAVIDALSAVASAGPPAVLAGGKWLDLAAFAAVLPRVGNWRPDSVLAVLETMAAAGVSALNPAAAIRCGRDHWATVAALAAAGLPYPATVAGADPQSLAAAATEHCGLPCVVKQRASRQGVGVIRCTTRDHLEGVLESLWRLGEEVVVQRFCPPGGWSRRVLVLEGALLGATEHEAAGGEFRSNAARGASVREVVLSAEQVDLALAAAQIIGLGFCGVDLFPDGEHWVVGEVNPSPGWRHFGSATGTNVAARLVAALARCGGVG
ncbi:MAG: RimK family alpha-L-glutamate ligase [Acidobacteriota bacterium]